jgi:predicted nucleotidyltransferase
MSMEFWEITQDKVQAVIKKIVETSNPLSIILFGSYVQGRMDINSDLDILVVVTDKTKNCRQESVRIRKSLRGILMPLDIIVVRKGDLSKFADAPGLIYTSALEEGRVVYEKAA